MTDDEARREKDAAFLERRDLTEKAKCLRHRLRTYGRAFLELADSPLDEQNRQFAEKATDLREDWADLKRALARIDELNKFLDLSSP